MNVVVLQGALSSEPIERTLPSGVNVMNWEVTTVTESGKKSVPVQWDDPPKQALVIAEGDEVVLLGVIRRRFFRTGGVTASRTEVLASAVAKPSQKVAVARLLAQAQERLVA